ncbi:hypothetical protein D9M69_564950 [compost metagenome]
MFGARAQIAACGQGDQSDGQQRAQQCQAVVGDIKKAAGHIAQGGCEGCFGACGALVCLFFVRCHVVAPFCVVLTGGSGRLDWVAIDGETSWAWRST